MIVQVHWQEIYNCCFFVCFRWVWIFKYLQFDVLPLRVFRRYAAVTVSSFYKKKLVSCNTQRLKFQKCIRIISSRYIHVSFIPTQLGSIEVNVKNIYSHKRVVICDSSYLYWQEWISTLSCIAISQCYQMDKMLNLLLTVISIV